MKRLLHFLGFHNWQIESVQYQAPIKADRITGMEPETLLKVLHGCTVIYYVCPDCPGEIRTKTVAGQYLPGKRGHHHD